MHDKCTNGNMMMMKLHSTALLMLQAAPVPSKKASVPSLGAKLTAIKPPIAVLIPASVDSSSGHHMASGSMRASSPVLCAAISAFTVATAACAASGSSKDQAASAVGDLAVAVGP
jgi:hypothetical protein